MSDHTEFSAMLQRCDERIAQLEAELADAKAKIEVTDEDALQLLRGYWRNVGASFGEMEIKHMVELLEAFVASNLKAPLEDRRETL